MGSGGTGGGPARRCVLAGFGLVALAGCDRSGHVGQEGVTRPAVPQPYTALAVFDLTGRPGETLAGLGAAVTGGGPAGVTVTVGVGPRLGGFEELPVFARERIEPAARGGDLLIQVCGATEPAVWAVLSGLRARLGRRARIRWGQRGFRRASFGAVRNILGFHDGVAGPTTESEFRREVWREDGSTFAVVRRIRLDVGRFLRLPVPEQERVVGRRRADGAPLSGGAPLAAVDLEAAAPDGRRLIPDGAHVRRAHASGGGRMLRRGYTFDDGPRDRGLLFVGFQRELGTFTETQSRLDQGDALMAFTTTTASGAFLILPGFDARRPLGSTLMLG
ncbi:Dyp-type peroxidase [Rhizohabitans arisaemae]|uniref:Dyp-type peroxidase n=1 Tax=Rhizohabitans arisaemae TaxID=2720610 RepID=UPI0024B077AC|nr:Dyp-type peroxidase [Rhizohabitans arisaemae]